MADKKSEDLEKALAKLRGCKSLEEVVAVAKDKRLNAEALRVTIDRIVGR